MIAISRAEQLARLVIMFHQGGDWSPARRHLWREFTGSDDATTKTLCDFARLVLREEEEQRADDLDVLIGRLCDASADAAILGTVEASRKHANAKAALRAAIIARTRP